MKNFSLSAADSDFAPRVPKLGLKRTDFGNFTPFRSGYCIDSQVDRISQLWLVNCTVEEYLRRRKTSDELQI